MLDFPAVLAFVLVIATVYVLALSAMIRMLLRAAGIVLPASRRVLRVERLFLLLAVVGLICFAYGYYLEPYWPQVIHVRIETPKLNGANRPVRVVQISDLHCDPKPRLENRLPEIIAAQKPDLIVFTGDSINSEDGLPVLHTLLPRLVAIAPTFVVRGNWDTGYWRGVDLFGNTGVTELNGQAVQVKAGGDSVWLGGAAFASVRNISKAMNGAAPTDFTVLLYHTPDEILDVAESKQADLYLAGHTHGGQVAMPLYGALITLSKFGKKYESGLHKEGDTWLYVNRGIGMEGGSAPRVRFLARPEVTVFELSPAAHK